MKRHWSSFRSLSIYWQVAIWFVFVCSLLGAFSNPVSSPEPFSASDHAEQVCGGAHTYQSYQNCRITLAGG